MSNSSIEHSNPNIYSTDSVEKVPYSGKIGEEVNPDIVTTVDKVNLIMPTFQETSIETSLSDHKIETIDENKNLEKLANEIEKSINDAKMQNILSEETEIKKLYLWSEEHIKLHKIFEKELKHLQQNQGSISPEILITWEKSKETMGKISDHVDYDFFLKSILSDPLTYADKTNLLVPLSLHPGAQKIRPTNKEWELNFGLLHSMYKRTTNEKNKEMLRFLMANYLAKAAYLNPALGFQYMYLQTEDMTTAYQDMLQVGIMVQKGMYHRTGMVQKGELKLLEKLGLNNSIGSAKYDSENMIILDNIEIKDLYPLSFHTLPSISKTDANVDIFAAQFNTSNNDLPKKGMDKPFLIDVTAEIGQDLITEGNEKKKDQYKQKELAIKKEVIKIIELSAARIKKEHPELSVNEKAIAEYLLSNTLIVCRGTVRGIGVLSTMPSMFDEQDFSNKSNATFRNIDLSMKIEHWASLTGITIGAVNFRKAWAKNTSDPSELLRDQFNRPSQATAIPVDYPILGKSDLMMYPKPADLMKTNVFKKMESIANGKDKNAGKAQVLLAKASVKMIQTLLAKISDKDWAEKQKDPVVLELTQTTVYRLMQHCAAASDKLKDFRQYSQAIDRIHAELTTLLLIYKPFNTGSFEEKYRNYLKPLLQSAEQIKEIGIAKSAMNVFSGVLSAIMKDNAHPVILSGEQSYYEKPELLGERTILLKDVLNDPNVKKADLYVAEYYHNIDISSNVINYTKSNVEKDIEEIFKKKPATDNLTVAIDATIDFTKSKDIQSLLKKFQKEIKAGKLNIVVFRSGQKFDMLGLDNYFGGPFYIINNGEKKWDSFNKIKSDPVFQTDELSQQYFSWITESGPELVDEYKKLIFDNTRDILDIVPPSLKAKPGRKVCVCNVDKDVKTPFIDIKLDASQFNDVLILEVQNLFMSIFAQNEKLTYRRGSFGFAHPNITVFMNEKRIRINPGIDPTEKGLYQQFFKNLEMIVKSLKIQ